LRYDIFMTRKKNMLTTKEFAAEVNAPYTTVMQWIKDNRIPEAMFDDTVPRGGVWYIPQAVVKRFLNEASRPRRGRPKKVLEDK
jgi:excisionase family DNA binding protein